MSRTSLLVTHLGDIAYQVLRRQNSAVVSGIASRGLYLQPSDDLTLYLSLEGFHGPLTLNLAGNKAIQEDLKPGMEVFLDPGVITIPGGDFRIDLSQAEIWQAILTDDDLPLDIRIGKLEVVTERALMLSKDQDFHQLLNSVLPGNVVSIPEIAGFSPHLKGVLSGLESKDLVQVGTGIQGLIGLGPGLTPLGDDLILGILLTLNRWIKFTGPIKSLVKLNQDLLISAQKKTSILSASLLVCAVEGKADERLLFILDSIFSGEESNQNDLLNLLNWGSSSGIAVLSGMLAVLTRYFK